MIPVDEKEWRRVRQEPEVCPVVEIARDYCGPVRCRQNGCSQRSGVLLAHESVTQVHVEVGRIGKYVAQSFPVNFEIRFSIQMRIRLNSERKTAAGGTSRMKGVFVCLADTG